MKLDKEEKEILKSYESGEWKSVKKLDFIKKKHMEYARAMLRKDKRLNIRISLRDLEGVQRIAVEEGIPYQTLVSSVIHKYVAGY
ncbi:antitoxin [bacterium]|nr:antitoxin [bacterium]